jgi:hypothetical protein
MRATEEGRPYFVMEYVPGLPITTYCDEQRLSTSARLELSPTCAGRFSTRIRRA